MTPHVLVVDDDPTAVKLLSKQIQSFGYTCDVAYSGEEAIEKVRLTKYQVMITDLEMGVMNGDELIEKAKKIDNEVVCLIISAVTEIDRIIPSLNQHKAYDFINKPVKPSLLKNTVDKACEVYLLRKKSELFSENEKVYHEELLEMFDWKKELHAQKFESFASKIIRQMNIGLFHGGGVGGLLTTLSLVFSRSKLNENGKYELTPRQFDLLKENYEISRDLVNGFTKAQAILMDEEKYRDLLYVDELEELLEGYRDKLFPMMEMKEQRVVISSLPASAKHKQIYYEKDIMSAAFNEILINAMKYSGKKDKIFIIFFSTDTFLEMKILNPAYKNQDGTIGITGSNEMMVFEPFFRMSTVSNEGYTMEEFGAGVGLTVVKKIMEKHGAEINIYTVKNYSAENTHDQDVCVTLRFPYHEETRKNFAI